ncbi:ABC transporter permease [Dictyobacter formicarum]|uniref:Glutathione ABC transporter permease n=1 Tax=Dictyobacter formicarum TaxID=2778368 RepID=A0ABQ3VEB2_9CHLR|nr:ABC transporter permease [Dictyobacter formicarum]GHO84492.1 glutathione ABC transporter permease [Dictyobacter formicarum]
MAQFLLKRLIGLVFVLLGVTFITFIIGYAAPGDPIQEMMGNHFNLAQYLRLKHQYGLDLPLLQQYFNYIVRLLHGDLGTSFQTENRPVWDILKDGVPTSLELGMWGLLVQVLIGIPLGILAALKSGTWIDTISMGLAIFLFSVPSFILASLFQVAIVYLHNSVGLSWPVAGWGNAWQYTPSDIQFKLGPIIIYAAIGLAYFARLTRTSTLEVLRQDYIRTARAKGLKERVVVYRHAMRNALIPIITVLGVTLGFLVTGAFFTENVFNINGIGYITIQSITTRDYPVIQATTVLLATGVVLGNLISDLLYTAVDPRIKVS